VLSKKIKVIRRNSRETHGAPRIHAELRAIGVLCGRKRVARLMRRATLRGCLHRRRMGTTHCITLQQVPRIWSAGILPPKSQTGCGCQVAAITYAGSKEGFIYPAFILDACNRRCSAGRWLHISGPTSSWMLCT